MVALGRYIYKKTYKVQISQSGINAHLSQFFLKFPPLSWGPGSGPSPRNHEPVGGPTEKYMHLSPAKPLCNFWQGTKQHFKANVVSVAKNWVKCCQKYKNPAWNSICMSRDMVYLIQKMNWRVYKSNLFLRRVVSAFIWCQYCLNRGLSFHMMPILLKLTKNWRSYNWLKSILN